MALPTPCPDGLPPTWAAGDYAGILRRVINQHKDSRRGDLTGLLVEIIRPVLLRAPSDAFVVVVPSTPTARAKRGGHPLDDIVRSAAATKQHCIRPLVWAKSPQDQSSLTARQRHQNLHGMLLSTGLPPGKPVVLVDDVLTTGATLAEAARALRRAGVEPRHAVVIAATRRRNVPPKESPR